MAALARLRHREVVTSGKVFAPNGLLQSVEGVIETDDPLNAEYAWRIGYCIDERTGTEVYPGEFEAYLASLDVVDSDSPAEGSDDTDESQDADDTEQEQEPEDEDDILSGPSDELIKALTEGLSEDPSED